MNINIEQWQYVTGKKRPSGFGMWCFRINNEEIFIGPMTWVEAKKEAIKKAKAAGSISLILLG